MNVDPQELTTLLWQLATNYGIKVIGVFVLLIVARIVARWVGRSVARSMERGDVDATLVKFFSKLASTGIFVLAVIAALGVFGVETASFAAVLAGAGLAIGLAFQGTLSNFSAGVMLLVFRPFKVGDWVCVAGVSGGVDQIDLFTTTLDTADNRRLIVPNSSIFGTTIENVTYHDIRRVEVLVGTSYGADLDRVREVLEQVCRNLEGVLAEPAPAVYLWELGSSSIDWRLRVWANTPDFWAVRERLTRAAKVALDNEGISIPFPQMDVHLDSPNPAGT
jgi:small conductance mechanosensitive channel